MPNDLDTNIVEQHGCIVCGKVYNLLVVYNPGGKLVDCAVISPGGRRVEDANRPLVACNKHPQEAIKAALAAHYPGKVKEDCEEDDGS
jgi:hypothetical protein